MLTDQAGGKSRVGAGFFSYSY